MITAEIDLEYVTKVRQSTFTLDNRRQMCIGWKKGKNCHGAEES